MAIACKIGEFESYLKKLDAAIQQGDNEAHLKQLDAELAKLSNEIRDEIASTQAEARLQMDFFMRRLGETDGVAAHSENFKVVESLLDRYMGEKSTVTFSSP